MNAEVSDPGIHVSLGCESLLFTGEGSHLHLARAVRADDVRLYRWQDAPQPEDSDGRACWCRPS